MPERVLLIAGEASGDLHGAGLVRALRRMRPGLDVYGVGGDRMREEGMDVLVHIDKLAFMGFAEVVKNLGTVRDLKQKLTALLVQRRPDVAVLIDYPGFNLRFARTIAGQGIPVVYYISPQVWAWHKSRVKKMRGVVTSMKVVFPFEVEIYREAGVDVEFVGHPIVERLGAQLQREDFFRIHHLDPSRKLLALLPGSRVQEIENIFPVMIEAATRLMRSHGIQVAVGVAPNLGLAPLAGHIGRDSGIITVEQGTYDLLNSADAAIVTSGTATLETGWFGTPMVIVYKTSALTYQIGRMVVKVPYIGLANIVAGKKIAPELIQGEVTADRLMQEVLPLLTDDAKARTMREDLSVIRRNLGGPGASERVAKAVLGLMKPV
ncbi:MAG: lipid-A-disaccharide synthase [Bacteroidota bacterium]